MPNEHPVKLLAANIFDSIASLTVQSIHQACEYSCTCNWVTGGTVLLFQHLQWQQQQKRQTKSEFVLLLTSFLFHLVQFELLFCFSNLLLFCHGCRHCRSCS